MNEEDHAHQPAEGQGETTETTTGEPRAGGDKPIGEERTSWAVPLLMMVTFGIYLYYWLWKTTEEAERFDPSRHRAHGRAKWTVGLLAGGIGAMLVAMLMLFSSAGFAEAGVSPDAMMAGGVVSIVLSMTGMFAIIAGVVVLYATLWRVWKWIRHHEQATRRDPISPGLMLGLLLGGAVISWIPFVGWIAAIAASFYAYYRTQQGFNNVWEAARRGYTPAEKPAPAGFAGQAPATGQGQAP